MTESLVKHNAHDTQSKNQDSKTSNISLRLLIVWGSFGSFGLELPSHIPTAEFGLKYSLFTAPIEAARIYITHMHTAEARVMSFVHLISPRLQSNCVSSRGKKDTNTYSPKNTISYVKTHVHLVHFCMSCCSMLLIMHEAKNGWNEQSIEFVVPAV